MSSSQPCAPCALLGVPGADLSSNLRLSRRCGGGCFRCGGGGRLWALGKSHLRRAQDDDATQTFAAARVAAGDQHSLFLTAEGKIFAVGNNAWGQLGIGSTTRQEEPVQLTFFESTVVTAVACGRNHSLALDANGQIYAFGSNEEGQLGSSEHKTTSMPVPVDMGKLAKYGVKGMACGAEHSCAIDGQGHVWVWGSGAYGQLGLGNTKRTDKPKQIKLHAKGKAVSIACGYYHTAVVLESGRVVVCGEADDGKLGLASDKDQNSMTRVSLPGDAKAVAVACGANHTAVICLDGRCLAWGSNASGQVGAPPDIETVSTPAWLAMPAACAAFQIACGESHTAVVAQGGQLLTCGSSRYGMLGIKKTLDDVFALRIADEVWPHRILSVACGGTHTLVIRDATPEDASGDQRAQAGTATDDIKPEGDHVGETGELGKGDHAAVPDPPGNAADGDDLDSDSDTTEDGSVTEDDSIVAADPDSASSDAEVDAAAIPASADIVNDGVGADRSSADDGPTTTRAGVGGPRWHQHAASLAPLTPAKPDGVSRSVVSHGAITSLLPPPVDAEWSDGAMSSSDTSDDALDATVATPATLLETPVAMRHPRSELNSTARAARRRTRALEPLSLPPLLQAVTPARGQGLQDLTPLPSLERRASRRRPPPLQPDLSETDSDSDSNLDLPPAVLDNASLILGDSASQTDEDENEEAENVGGDATRVAVVGAPATVPISSAPSEQPLPSPPGRQDDGGAGSAETAVGQTQRPLELSSAMVEPPPRAETKRERTRRLKREAKARKKQQQGSGSRACVIS